MTVAETPIADAAVIAERIAHLCYLAKREMPVVGTPRAPTPWDQLHKRIDAQLDNWQRCK